MPPPLFENAAMATRAPFIARIGLIAMLLGNHLFAASLTWDAGGATGNWGTASNWNPDANPASSDDLIFATSGTTSLNNDSAVNNTYGLTFNSGSSAFTLAGNAITLDGTHGIANNGTSL